MSKKNKSQGKVESKVESNVQSELAQPKQQSELAQPEQQPEKVEVEIESGIMTAIPEVQQIPVVTARRSSYPFGDLVASSAAKAKIPRSYAHKCIKAFLEDAKTLISQGHSVNFSQFGSFDARVIHAKVIRTPQGKLIQTVDRVRVRFHNSTKLNELMDSVGTKALEKQGFSPVWKPFAIPTENGKVKENTTLDSTESELDEILQGEFDV